MGIRVYISANSGNQKVNNQISGNESICISQQKNKRIFLEIYGENLTVRFSAPGNLKVKVSVYD